MNDFTAIKRALINECRSLAIFSTIIFALSLAGVISCVEILAEDFYLSTCILLIFMSAILIAAGAIAANNIRDTFEIKKGRASVFDGQAGSCEYHPGNIYSYCLCHCRMLVDGEEKDVRFEIPGIMATDSGQLDFQLVHIEKTRHYHVAVALPRGNVFVGRNVFVLNASTADKRAERRRLSIMGKRYHIRCKTGYAILGEAPPKMDNTVLYRIVGESAHYPHCFIVERCDGETYCGNRTWVVHADALIPA